ncbi:MAG TPA: prolyl oligopeptidase family serine peptidase [Vicinamibacteria bacterium]|nr:prolyl oligopeptidase family serine peptidase [Vicinamibacteria bacterium]
MRRPWFLALAAALAPLVTAAEVPDPFAWLEEVEGEKPLAWAREQSARTLAELQARPEYGEVYARTLALLDSKDKIPSPTLLGTTVYNFWKDDAHERGIWRRASVESFRAKEPAWETVLDIDALARSEGKPWVFKGAECLPPDYRKCLVNLSRGGADATVVREFDTVTKAFVEGGFQLAEAKSSVDWVDADTLWVGTDFGPGSLTTSGYPRVVRLWKRGTALADAPVIFEGQVKDVYAFGFSIHAPERRYDLVMRVPAFYRQETFVRRDGKLLPLGIPEDADFNGILKGQVLVSLRTDWTTGGRTYRAGSLLAADLDAFLQGRRDLHVLFEPSERVSLAGVAATRDRVLVVTLDNVRSRLASHVLEGGAWKRSEVPLPGSEGAATVTAASDEADVYYVTYQDFLSPTSLWEVSAGGPPLKVKTMPAFFDPTGMKVAQHEATSKDGTKIPYFVITPKGFVADGSAPTILYGYGGFEVSMDPTYSGSRGFAWLEKGGVYVVANIRGGGEFGPRWHEAALKDKRIKSFEDFIAVAEDLVARKITSPRRLGIIGGSQGGLLVGGAYTMRPDLFGAVVSAVPLADMQRFHKLLAGASWMAEYGDPDKPEDWKYIQSWSPYHLLKKDARYPTPFFWTNTRDDRVHPGHARKMVARMQALGHPVYYFENTEGGHGSGVVNKQTAHVTALEYAYFWKMLSGRN